MSFISWMSEDFSIHIIEVICGKSQWRVKKRKKPVVFQIKKANNLETFWFVFKKNGNLLETSMLKYCGNFQVCE